MSKKRTNSHEHVHEIENVHDRKHIKDQASNTKKNKVNVSTSLKTKSKLLFDAPQENYFILCNGQPVKNVKELAGLLENIDDSVFNHHVNLDKNDFSNWIKDIFEDSELAKELAGVTGKEKTSIVLYRHLVKH